MHSMPGLAGWVEYLLLQTILSEPAMSAHIKMNPMKK